MARQGARDDHGRPDGRPLRPARQRHADGLRRLLPRLHRGHRRHRRGGRGDRCRRSPRATTRACARSRPSQHFTQPPPRYTEATLIKALEEHGIGRPSTYAATISTIIDRGYVRSSSGGCGPSPSARSSRTCWSSTSASSSTRLHGAHGGGARRGRRRRARSGCRCCASSTGRSASSSTEKRKELKRSDFTTEATDEVCSEGHPMVIRLGRNGRFLACSLYPEHKETRPLPGRGAGDAGRRGRGRGLPGVRTGHAGRAARTVRAVRRLLALPRLQVHPQDRSAAARAAAIRGHLPQVRRGPPDRAPRAPDGQPSSGAARAIRSATSRRRASRWARSTTPTTARWRARAEKGAICLKCGAPIELPEPVSRRAKLCPAASQIPRRWPAPRRPGRWRPSTAANLHERARRSRRAADDRRSEPAAPGRVTGTEALDAFLGRLAARDASDHTRCALIAPRQASTSTGWTSSGRLARARPAPLRALPGRAGRAAAVAGARSAAASPRCARSTATPAARASSGRSMVGGH